MIMNMLAAGGMSIVTDRLRNADEDNPLGYFEYEPVKNLSSDSSWISDIRGKAVKIISQLLYNLPSTESYRIIFINRNMSEILASQEKMLERRGVTNTGIDDSLLAAKFIDHLTKVMSWIGEQKHIQYMTVQYEDIIQNPMKTSEDMNQFLGMFLDATAMAAVVDPSLYRNRKESL